MQTGLVSEVDVREASDKLDAIGIRVPIKDELTLGPYKPESVELKGEITFPLHVKYAEYVRGGMPPKPGSANAIDTAAGADRETSAGRERSAGATVGDQ